jgi:hypothetical protein
MADREPTDVVQLKFRVVESLRRRLEIEARSHRTTLNQEITRRLEESLDRRDDHLQRIGQAYMRGQRIAAALGLEKTSEQALRVIGATVSAELFPNEEFVVDLDLKESEQ